MTGWSWLIRRHRKTWWFAAAVVLVAVAFFALEQRRRDGLYWHDVHQDHRYAFSNARVLPIALEADGFTLPTLPEDAQTLLLRLELKTTLRGKWSEPFVEVEGPGGERNVQFLARGGRGTRYVDLSPALKAPLGPGVWVTLRGGHAGWEPQPAELLVFARPPLDEGPVLVLAPHPDDAEIAAFALYSETDSWVVTVSAGNGVDQRLSSLVADPAARSRLKGELRAWDSVAVPLWGDVPAGRVANLGYFTQSLAPMYSEPSRPFADPVLESTDIREFRRAGSSEMLAGTEPRSTWDSLVADLVAVLNHVRPRTVVTPHPALDAAPDHKLTTIALIEALAKLAPEPRTLLLYTNHHVTSEYFPFGPAQGVVSLPPWTDEALELDAVYSHPLEETMRIRKLYALEAQHDLRAAPEYVGTGPLHRIWRELSRSLTRVWRDPVDTYSYLRRAPRPNELFFVLSAQAAAESGLERFVAKPLQAEGDPRGGYSP